MPRQSTPPLPRRPPPIHLPPRLTEAIGLHVLRNLANLDGPLILGVHGPAGEGKTFGIRETLRSLKVHAYLVSGSDFESPSAGEPARKLRALYLRAAKFLDDHPDRGAVLLVNDIDLGLGERGPNVQTTINLSTACAELMHLADFPTRVGQQDTPRVPIVVTANALGTLHSPLTRSGRMRLLEWKLEPAEKLEAVGHIFADLDCDAVWSLFETFPTEPLAFFADLRDLTAERALRKAIGDRCSAEAVAMARRGGLTNLVTSRNDIDALIRLGRELKLHSHLRNHLRKRATP